MKKNYLFPVLISFFFILGSYAQVGVNTTNPNAALDIEASSRTTPLNSDGLLVPRINTFPATNPTALQNGMLVYLTGTVGENSPGFYYWEGFTATWVPFGAGGSSGGGGNDGGNGWSLLGNNNTDSNVNFLGTTDNEDLIIRTNNIERIGFPTTRSRIDFFNNGNSVFIGASAGELDDLTNNNNTFIGKLSANNNSTGSGNVAIGYNSLPENISGLRNTVIGSFGMTSNQSGSNNVIIGYQAFENSESGSNNVVIGTLAAEDAGDGVFIPTPQNNLLYIENFGGGQTPLIGGNFKDDQVSINFDIENLDQAPFNNYTFIVGGKMFAASYFSPGGELVPDYVFEDYYTSESKILPSYKFNTLEFTEQFVKDNGHLPGVTSYEEMKSNDFQYDVADFSRINLEKIEESFLYITELNAKIKSQQKELSDKDEKINDLEKRLKRLEELILSN